MMLLWFILVTGVITISAAALLSTLCLVVMGWFHNRRPSDKDH